MKSAKRVLAVLIAMLMIVSTCAVAASAAVQDSINAATTGYKLPGQTVGSIVIDGKDNFVLDLNGYELVSDFGQPAITIKNSTNVTIRNGFVTSRFADEKRPLKIIEGLKDGKSPSGIVVNGGTVTIEGVRIDAGRTVVPEVYWEIPTGSGLQVTGNAVVTLKQAAILGGDYAIYNSAGKVVVEDALLVGAFAAALKPANVVSAEGTEEKVNAADRILGALNAGVTLDPDELEVFNTVMGDRINIYTKSITDKAPVTVTNGSKVEAEASVISHLWTEEAAGDKKTDCSYKYVPEYLKLENGTTYAFNDDYSISIAGEKNVTDKAEVLYRLEFEIADDIKELISEYYNWDTYWAKIPAKVKSAWRGTMPKYNEYVDMAADAFDSIFNLIGEVYEMTDGEVDLTEDPSYMAVLNDLFALGGSTIQKDLLTGNKVPGYDRLTNSCYATFDDVANNVVNAYKDADGKYYFDGDVPADVDAATPLYVYGLLDKIDLFLNDIDGFVANIDNENTWREPFYFAYANFDNLLDMIPQLNEVLKQLKADLEAINIDEVLAIVNDFNVVIDGKTKTVTDLLREGIEILDQVEEALPELLQNETYVAARNFLDGQDAEWVKACMDKALYMYHNRDQYVDVDSLLLEGGNFAKAYAVYGPIDLTIVNTGEVDLKLTIYGRMSDSSVTVSIDEDDAITQMDNGPVDYLFYDQVTLTANEDGDDEFLYWVNGDTNRILTTEKTITFSTKIDRNVWAVFVCTEYADFDEFTNEVVLYNNANATFTNNSGAIAASIEYEPIADNVIMLIDQPINEPYLPGYTFEGWPYADEMCVDLAQAAADGNNKYATGSSVFADMDAAYDNAGYALPVRTGSDSYIIIAKFAVGDEPVLVTFTDKAANTIYESEMPYGYTVTVTASGSNFSYWKDAATGDIVCFEPTFTYASIGNRTQKDISKNFVAVYGASTSAPCASRIAFAAQETEKVSLYFQRAVKPGQTMITSGIIYKFGSADGLKVDAVDNVNVFKGTSKSSSNVGTYILGISNTKFPGQTLYAIPFIEIAGQDEPILGQMVTVAR